MRRPGERSLWGIFRVPLYVGIATTVGLVAALLTDGPWDLVWSGAAGVPVLVAVAHFVSGQRGR